MPNLACSQRSEFGQHRWKRNIFKVLGWVMTCHLWSQLFGVLLPCSEYNRDLGCGKSCAGWEQNEVPLLGRLLFPGFPYQIPCSGLSLTLSFAHGWEVDICHSICWPGWPHLYLAALTSISAIDSQTSNLVLSPKLQSAQLITREEHSIIKRNKSRNTGR
jgi:hypothetical protein